MQAIRADQFRGKRIRLAGFVKTRAVTGICGIWIRIDQPQSDILSAGPERKLSGTKDWTLCSAVFDVPKDAKDICLGPLLVGAGQVWVSDLKLEAVDSRQFAQTPRADSLEPRKVLDSPSNLRLTEPWNGAGSVPGWEPWDKKEFRAHMASNEFKGKPVLVFKGVQNGEDGINQSFKAQEYRGRRVKFSAWVKSTSAPDDCDMGMVVTAKSHETLASDDLDTEKPKRSLRGTTGWVERDIVLDVPQAADSLSISVGIEGAGTMEVSQINLQVVSRSVAITYDGIKQGTGNLARYISGLPLYPRNLQFNM
jgi:hypothetical protein